MKIAIIHDQLQEFGGAERVLVALKKIFPKADIYTSFYNSETLGVQQKHFQDWKIITSWADRLPLLKKIYSPLRFITPLIWESFDFSQYDLVISSSGAYMSKGIITKPETLHISYLHHQPRYLYYYETAIEWQKYLPFKIYGNIINHDLRLWDFLSSQRVDYFIANSEETKKRIQKFYRRDSLVIYPPVDIPKNSTILDRSDQDGNGYFITISRLVRSKHIDILIETANKMKFRLKIIGNGRDEKYLRSIAGETVEFLNDISDDTLNLLYKNAKAFLFAAVDEEFGIAPVEAMGYGLPVIAFASGGIKETIKDGFNGFLFNRLSQTELFKKIKLFESLAKEKNMEMRKNARKEAEKYSFENFRKQILKFINIHARASGS